MKTKKQLLVKYKRLDGSGYSMYSLIYDFDYIPRIGEKIDPSYLLKMTEDTVFETTKLAEVIDVVYSSDDDGIQIIQIYSSLPTI